MNPIPTICDQVDAWWVRYGDIIDPIIVALAILSLVFLAIDNYTRRKR